MKCPNCHAEWTMPPQSSVVFSNCPFCGASLAREEIRDPLARTLFMVYQQLGDSGTRDGEKLTQHFVTLAPSLKKESKMLSMFVRCGGHTALLDAKQSGPAALAAAEEEVVGRMTEELMAEEHCRTICRAFRSAIGCRSAPAQPAAPDTAPAPEPPGTAPIPSAPPAAPAPSRPETDGIDRSSPVSRASSPAAPADSPAPAASQPSSPAPSEEPLLTGFCDIGIDLCSSRIRAAIFQDGKPILLPISKGRTELRNLIGSLDGRFLCGEEAEAALLTNPGSIFRDVPALVRFAAEQQSPAAPLPEVQIALLLRRIGREAEKALGKYVDRAVVTIPASLGPRERQILLDAGKLANLNLRLLHVSSAAGLHWQQAHKGHFTICALTDTCFEVSVAELDGDDLIEVLAVVPGSFGLQAYDDCVAQWITDTLRDQRGVSLAEDAAAQARFRNAAARARIDLCSLSSARIHIPNLLLPDGRVIQLELTLSRTQFEALTAHLTDALQAWIRQALSESGLVQEGNDTRKKAGSRLVLAGSGAQLPVLRSAAMAAAGAEPEPLSGPSLFMVYGAAVQAGILDGASKGLLLDVTPYAVGVDIRGVKNRVLIPRSTTIPAMKVQQFSTVEDNQAAIDVHLLRGERPVPTENDTICWLSLKVAPAPKCVPRVTMALSLSLNGTLDAEVDFSGNGTDVATVQNLGGKGLREEQIKQLRASTPGL